MSSGEDYLLELKRRHPDNPVLQEAVDAVLAEREQECKLPEVWAAEKYLRVRDPDGWRDPAYGIKPWDTPLTEAEFEERLLPSTIELLPGHPDRLVPAPPSSEQGYLLLALADDFLAEFDDEMIDASDVHNWLVREAVKRGAKL